MNTFTGALKSPKDGRDIKLGSVQAPVELPETYLPDYSNLEIYNQNGQPACGGHAGARAKATLDYLEDGKVKYYSPRFIYALAKHLDGITGGGTYTRMIGKILASYGVCDNNLFLNNVSLPYEEYKNYDLITSAAFENAQPRIIKSYAFVGTDVNSLKQAIYQDKAVILLIYPFFKGGTDGHFVFADGWNGDKIRYANSFGMDWGTRGYGWYEEGGFQEVLEAMTMIDLPDSYVSGLTNDIAILRKIVELYIKIKTLLKGVK
jgi:hypothetical protein